MAAWVTDVSIKDGLSNRVAHVEVLRPVKAKRDVTMAACFGRAASVPLRASMVVPAQTIPELVTLEQDAALIFGHLRACARAAKQAAKASATTACGTGTARAKPVAAEVGGRT